MSVKPASSSLMALSTPAIPAPMTTKRMSTRAGSQPVEDQRDDEIGNLGCGDAVVGGQPPVCQLTDRRRQGVGDHPGRCGYHLAALLSDGDDVFDVVDEPLVDAAKVFFEPVTQRVGVAEKQLDGGFVGFEELERRLDRGAKRRRTVTALQRSDSGGEVAAQRVLLDGHQRVEQLVLRVEVPVDRAVGEASLLGDVGDGRVVKTLAREHLFGRRHDFVAPLRLVLGTDRATPAGRAAHLSTRSSSRPMVSMNSSTMSSTTERVGRTRSSEPTTCPTK